MIEGIWNNLRSRMRLPTACVFSKISIARARPLPSLRGMSCWHTIPLMDSEIMLRTWGCSSGGNASRIRSIVRAAEVVWIVPNTRAPFCERRNAGLHDPEGTVPSHPLLDDTATVHALVRDDVAKVECQLRVDALPLFVGQNLKQETFGFCGGERRARKRREATVLPDDGGRRHVDVQVRAPDIAGVGQIVVQVSERGDFRRVRLGDQRTGGGINFRSRNRSRGGRWPWIFASHRAG